MSNDRPSRLIPGLTAAAMAGALFIGAAGCGDPDEPQPSDPVETNVEADDMLPPGDERQLDGSSMNDPMGY